MRSRLFSFLCGVALGLGAAAAQAGTLTLATWTTEVYGVNAGNPFVVPVTATGTSTTNTSVAVSLTIPAFSDGALSSGALINTYRQLTLSGSQMLTAQATVAAATQGIKGAFRINTAVHAAKGANASMLTPGVQTLLKVGLNVGVGGGSTGYFYISTQPHYMTVDFYAWTAQGQTFTGLTVLGKAIPDLPAMASFNLTAMGGGSVLLVSPSLISIDGPLMQRRTVNLSTLKLTFAPEPGTWLLLGVGALALLRFHPRS